MKAKEKPEIQWFAVTGMRVNEAFAAFLTAQCEGSAHDTHNLRVEGESVQCWFLKPAWTTKLLQAHHDDRRVFESLRFVKRVSRDGKAHYADFFREMRSLSTKPKKKVFMGAALVAQQLAREIARSHKPAFIHARKK